MNTDARSRGARWLERMLVPFRLTFVPSWVKLDDLGLASDPEPAPLAHQTPEPALPVGHRCLRPELPRAA